jgi:dihydroorotate dehydrogenase electron transfer subunit
MMQKKYTVTGVQNLSCGIARLNILAPELAKMCSPGQFAHIYCGGGVYSITRRPLSISSVSKDEVSFLFQIKGEGTRWLSKRKPGDIIDIVAPVGHGFSLPDNGEVVLAAGGIGLAPLIFLGQEAIKKGLQVVLLFGARNKQSIYGLDELTKAGAVIKLATEDGSAGEKGLVTKLLEKHILSSKPAGIFSCGPKPMLEAVAKIGQLNDIPVQVSLEERMACGVGACRGCAVLVKNGQGKGYRNVCSDGPVFKGEEVFFND